MPIQKSQIFSYLRAAAALTATLVLMSITTDFPGPAKGGGTGWCSDYEGNNFPCSDTPTTGGGTDYGYGGGGCAAYDTSDYNSGYNDGPTYVGEYHPEHSNVVWNGENWIPADGYEWISDDPYDYSVQPLYGTSHPTYSNVVWDGDGWVPSSGYEWATDDTYDYTVQRIYGSAHPEHPNVEWQDDGWYPMDGYTWASDDQDDYSVVSTAPSYGDTHPYEANVWWNGSKWEPAEGYTWATDDPADYSVVEAGPDIGDTHPDSENVYWTGDSWIPLEGFVWLNDASGDYRVVPAEKSVIVPSDTVTSDTVPSEELVNAVPLLRQSTSQLASLQINEVPSPSGYKSASERRVQLEALSDQHLEDQLAHIKQTMVAMGEDFRADSAALQAWYEDSRQAEEDALKASFTLLMGVALDEKFDGVWKNLPKMKTLAKNGMRIISFEGPVRKLSEDVLNPDANREMLAAYMGELTGQLHDFDAELVSTAGARTVGLASFFIDYTYQAAKWSVSRDQILMITNNLDKPNGKLEAQKSLSRLQEDLYEERARRQGGG